MIDFAQNPEYLRWAGDRLGQHFQAGQAVTLTQLSQQGSILGVVVFSRFTTGNCEVTVVGHPKRWLSKGLVLRSLLYAFGQMEMRRVTAFIAVGNDESLSLAQQLGFRIEGAVRDWFPTGNAYILGLLQEDCKKWFKDSHGQPGNSAST